MFHSELQTDVYNRISYLSMPKLSPTMTSGKLTKWHASNRQYMKSYDLITEVSALSLVSLNSFEVTAMEIELIEDMYISKILVPADDDAIIAVGTPIAILCEEESDIDVISSWTLTAEDIQTLCLDKTKNIKTAMWQAYLKHNDDVNKSCGCS